MPLAEPLMLQAALKKEADAGLEELLGHLNKARKLYAASNQLVEGVALTAQDPEEQRKLQNYSASLQEKVGACSAQAKALLMFED